MKPKVDSEPPTNKHDSALVGVGSTGELHTAETGMHGEKPLRTVYLLFKNKHKPFEKSSLLEKTNKNKVLEQQQPLSLGQFGVLKSKQLARVSREQGAKATCME